jgi:hypothetical protein
MRVYVYICARMNHNSIYPSAIYNFHWLIFQFLCFMKNPILYRPYIGLAVAQAINRWLPSPVAWIVSKYFGFPYHSLIPLITPQWPSSIIESWCNRPISGGSSSEHFQLQPHTSITPWPIIRRRNLQTERPPLVGEIQCQLLRIEEYRVVSAADALLLLISVF